MFLPDRALLVSPSWALQRCANDHDFQLADGSPLHMLTSLAKDSADIVGEK